MFIKALWPAITWAIVLLFLHLLPGKFLPKSTFFDLLSFDKFVHMIMFLILTMLSVIGFTKQYRFASIRSYAGAISLMLAIFYGLSLESMQGLLMQDRYFDFYDLVANSMGCLLGIIIFKFVSLTHQ